MQRDSSKEELDKLTTNPGCLISILFDPRATLSYITPSVVESSQLKKLKHVKSWLVQLSTGTKRKVA
jgi:hypothetical protein